MNIKHISLVFAAAALLAGCSKSPIEDVKPSEQLTDLELAYVGATETKAAIDGTDFPQTGEIGLFLFKDELAETPYRESGYTNVKYAYNSSNSKWTDSPSIKVGSTPGYLYGYYPYDSEATDVKAIPVESSLNGDDVMYASKQAEPITDATAANTAITMNHALARVSIKVINKGYTGLAKLSSIKFADAKTSLSGSLDATTGTISGTTRADVTLTVPSGNQTITSDGTTYECLLVPSEKEKGKQTVKLTLTIDGIDKEATLSGENGVIIAQGTKSNITITLSNSGISVQTVSVEKWQTVQVGDHKVTVKVADDVTAGDIMFAPYVDGNNVIINVISLQGKRLVCNVGDKAQCERVITNDKFTFTISEINSDIDAVLGYAPLVTLTVTSDSNGKVWIGDDMDKTSGQFQQGEQVVIHAATDNQFRLFKWNDNGRELTKTITMGLTDTTYSASFISSDLIPGLFTVNTDDKKVFFSKGNLWCDGTGDGYTDAVPVIKSWGFEDNQYDSNPASDGNRSISHISHFMWCKRASESVKQQYAESDTASGDIFFTDKDDFAVNGVSSWRTLTGGSGGEWEYLLETRAMKYGKPRYTEKVSGVTIDGTTYRGLFIYPDDYTGSEVGASGGPATWAEINAAGIVFLPASGLRNGEFGVANIFNVGALGEYWSGSPDDGSDAYCPYFSGLVYLDNILPRSAACSVRLVTEYQSEPSEE